MATEGGAAEVVPAQSRAGAQPGVRLESCDLAEAGGRIEVEVSRTAELVEDPVCGTQIRPEEAVATKVHDGKTPYFHSEECQVTPSRRVQRHVISTPTTTSASTCRPRRLIR